MHGYGNCGKHFSRNGKTGPICFVSQPSTCNDRETSPDAGDFSWQACLNEGNIFNLKLWIKMPGMKLEIA